MKTYRKKCKNQLKYSSYKVGTFTQDPPFSKTNESYAHFPWNKNLKHLSVSLFITLFSYVGHVF